MLRRLSNLNKLFDEMTLSALNNTEELPLSNHVKIIVET